MGLVGIGLGVGGLAILAWTALARTPAPRSRPTAPPSPGTASPSPGTAPPSPGTASPFPGTAPLSPGTAPRSPGTASPFPGTAPPSPGGGGWTFEDYEAGWRAAHLLGEEARPGGRLAAWYLRLPYALGAPLARVGVDPDLVTLAALWVALVAGWTATLGPGWAAAAGGLTLAAGIADSVDGAVAVLQRRTSVFGFVWDSTADRLADLAMIAGPVALVATRAGPGWGKAAVAAGTAAAGLLLLLEYVRARAQAAQVAAAWTLATPGERPTRVIVLGLTGLAVGAAQLGGDGLATAALDLGYPVALAVLALLEAAGCAQLLVAVRHATSPLR